MRSKAVELEISCFFVILCITDFDFEDEGVVVLVDLSEDFAETELLMTDDLVIEDVAEVILTVVVLVSDDVVAGWEVVVCSDLLLIELSEDEDWL